MSEATGVLTLVDTGNATATDNADPNPSVTSNTPVSFSLGNTIVTWTATDSSNNTATAIQTVTIQDTTAPTITVPPDTSFNTTGTSLSLTQADYGTATATDLVTLSPAVTSNAPASFLPGNTTITWTATDDYQNSATATQTITIIAVTVTDTVPPTITPSSDKTFEATGVLTPLSIGQIVAPFISDNVDTNPVLSNDIPASFSLGNTTVTWTATDSSNNTATAIQTVTIQDTTAPTITVPPDASFNATGMSLSLTQVEYGTATATDLVTLSPAVTSNAPASFPPGNTTITWTATDDYQNSATATQTITIIAVTVTDTVPPDVSSITRSDPADSATNRQTLVFNVAFSEAVTGVGVGNFVLSTDSPLTGTTQTRSQELAIPDGQTVQDTMAVSWLGTISALSVSVNITHAWVGDLKVELISPDDTVRLLHNMTGGSDDNIIETYTPDFAGKLIAGNWTLRLTDTIAPDPGVLNNWTLAFDSNPISGVSGTGDSRLVTVLASQNGAYNLDVIHEGIFDLAGNPLSNTATTGADESYTVILPDIVPPIVAAPPNVLAEATGVLTPVDTGNATATDDTDPNPSVTGDAPASFPLGSTTVTWTATDSSNNTATAIQTVTIQDTTPPSVTAPPDASFNATGTSLSLTQAEYGTATATDLVDLSPAVRNDAMSSFPLGNTTITWTATDDYQNSATATQIITVTGDTAPPSVSSIIRSDPANSATDSRTLVFNVTFSETVTGVNVDDFELSPDSPSTDFTYTRTPALAIPDDQTVQDIMAVSGHGAVSTISASVNITHTWIGDLKVELVSPNGTASVLHDNTGGSDDDITETYKPDFAGVQISGNWTLRITDTAQPDPGTLNGWTLTFGSNPITNVSGTGDSRLVTVSSVQVRHI